MRFAVATFCDAATTRVGLLNMLGAGINLISRDQWPAPLGATLAFMLEVLPEEAKPDDVLGFSVELRAVGFGSEPIATVEGGFTGAFSFTPDAPLQLAAVLPTEDILLPAAGRYRCSVQIVDGPRADIEFTAVTAPEGMQVPFPQDPLS